MRAWMILPVALWMAAGCEPGGLYENTRQFASGTVTARERWRAAGPAFDAPGKAVDGRSATAAVTGSDYANADLTIDLGEVCLFNTVVIDHGTAGQMGFPRRVAVLTSDDGERFERQTTSPGTRRVTVIPLIRPTLARYVRFRALVPGGRPWSVAEVHLQ